MKNKKIFGRYSIKEVKEVHFHDHEVYFAFLDDEGAEEFGYWWNKEGKKLFTNFLVKQNKEHLL